VRMRDEPEHFDGLVGAGIAGRALPEHRPAILHRTADIVWLQSSPNSRPEKGQSPHE
jgi:hypothetical protein